MASTKQVIKLVEPDPVWQIRSPTGEAKARGKTKEAELDKFIAKFNKKPPEKFEDLSLPILYDKIEKIGPARARQLYLTNTYEGQRPIGHRHVETIIRKKGTRLWRGNDIEICSLPTQDVMVNGQHTLAAIIASGIEAQERVIVYKCGSIQDVNLRFNQHDTVGRRNQVDIARSKTVDLGPLWKGRHQALIAIVTGYSREIGSYSTTRALLDLQDRVDLIDEFEFANEFRDLLHPQGAELREHLKRATVVHCIVKNFDEDTELAHEFWEKVGSGNNIIEIPDAKDRNPAVKLREYLGNITTSQDNSDEKKQRAESKDIYQRCAMAWQCFMQGEGINPKKLHLFSKKGKK